MKKLALVAAAAAVVFAAPAFAQTPPTGGVEWLTPVVPAPKPQSDAEKERGMRSGRDLPVLELLQPTLDPALAPYTPKARTAFHGHFKAAASDVLPGLAKAWVVAFQRYYPGVTIDVDPPYAGSLGAVELAKGNLDFVFVSRELRPDDITAFHARFGYDPLSVPICGGTYRHFGFLDTVGFIVNKANPVEHLTYAQLDAAFSTTHHRGGAAATTWGALGATGEWADKPVHLVGVKPWNGFEEFVRQRVLSTPGHRGEWRTDIDFSPTVFPIAGKVAADPYAIGYDGLAYLSAPVKVIAVSPETGGEYVSPTYENVAAATYPLARLVFFNTNKAPGKRLDPAVDEFLRFVLSRDGQAVVAAERLYMPLRSAQARTSLGLLAP